TRLNSLDACLTVPASAPDKADSVVVLNCDGDVQAGTSRLLQPEFPTETLRAFDGELLGKGQRFGPGKKTDDVILDWTKTDQSIIWPVRLEKPAAYEVVVDYDAAADAAGGTFEVSFGLQTLNGEVKSGTNQLASLGRVSLKPGGFEIKVTATK